MLLCSSFSFRKFLTSSIADTMAEFSGGLLGVRGSPSSPPHCHSHNSPPALHTPTPPDCGTADGLRGKKSDCCFGLSRCSRAKKFCGFSVNSAVLQFRRSKSTTTTTTTASTSGTAFGMEAVVKHCGCHDYLAYSNLSVPISKIISSAMSDPTQHCPL